MSVETSRILDLLANAVKRELREPGSWSHTFFLCMSGEERAAFDLFLVEMKDPLAWEAGTTESRFRRRVLRMAEQERERLAAKDSSS